MLLAATSLSLCMKRSNTHKNGLPSATASNYYSTPVAPQALQKCFDAIAANNPENLARAIVSINPEKIYPGKNKTLFHAQQNLMVSLHNHRQSYYGDSFTRADRILSILLRKADMDKK